MKHREQRFPIPVLLIVTILALLLLALVFWSWYVTRYEGIALSPNSFSDFGEKQYFSIHPSNILTSLDHGEKNVFAVETATPENPIYEEPVEWHQSDYLKIAEAANQFAWQEALDTWSMYYMEFSTACQDLPNGFELGEIAYFKSAQSNSGQIKYIVRAFQITPQYGDVTVASGASFPQPTLANWRSVNLGSIQVTADESLRIAEENGAQEARSAIQNNCTIRIRLSDYSGWRVRITENATSSQVFYVEIDPYTGNLTHQR